MKKKYTYTRVNLLIVLLSFQTFFSCVHTQTFSSCLKSRNVCTIDMENRIETNLQRSVHSSPSKKPRCVPAVIGGITFLVLGVTALYYFLNSSLVSNMIGANSSNAISDGRHISMRSVLNEDSGNSSSLFADKLDGYAPALESTFDNLALKLNNSLLTPEWIKALLAPNTKGSNHFIAP
ncbi:MAG: hypothetical protein NMK33_02225 [Candidatus Cardinium sp.]|uniref:hypothetical protein n=1 Tax=Cardinium endosymbiont of Dermatophagoides farinae TaxID=2597823 RepID=UPI001182EDE5|nr:hypothetical protein [Cardinium endosymbiont of Dermatophagoides farinae]TSJ81298.1 hypothetical protein FPG78_04900 [Cardinium endosymbiont of Dermatophagoides farinae]UWW97358.1 MAG: hypothetical protein NMK33_02225 [Candidatus Cardinium sp.]